MKPYMNSVLHIENTQVKITFFFFFFFRATPETYGRSQARGQIKAVAAGLHHSHSIDGSEPDLWPTPQLPAVPDP